ncbi:hypothetical protein [Escherichia phage AV109]|nr:hypothetical protein [Escherichia phage AV109]
MSRKEKISKLMFLIEEYANAVSDWGKCSWLRRWRHRH